MCEIHMDERTKWKTGHGSLLAITKPSLYSAPETSGTLCCPLICLIFLVSFHFCLIFTEWKSLIRYMFLLVYLICLKTFILSHLFLHCILLYVHKTNQRSNYVNLLFVYLMNHFPVTFFFSFIFCYVVFFGKPFYLYWLFFTFYLFESPFSCIR